MSSVAYSGLVPGTVTASGDLIAYLDISDHTQSVNGSLVSMTTALFFSTIVVPVNVTSASATALAVGLTGATNPAFAVDASTALQVAGLKVKGAVTTGTVAVVVTDSGAVNTNLTINALLAGTIGIGSVSTGRVTITPVTTISGSLTLSAALVYGGVTLSNAVTGTGNMVLSASPTFTGTAAFVAVTASGSSVMQAITATTVSATGIIATTVSGAGFTLTPAGAGVATYYVMDNTVNGGGKRWRFGYTGGAGTGVSTFDIYNETDAITAFTLGSTGAVSLTGAGASLALAPRDGSGTTWTIYNPTGDDLRFSGGGEIVFTNAGAVSGITTLAMTGALSGATSIVASSTIQGLTMLTTGGSLPGSGGGAFTNGAGALTGTLLNSPVTGNPTKWIPTSDNGTTRYIPAW